MRKHASSYFILTWKAKAHNLAFRPAAVSTFLRLFAGLSAGFKFYPNLKKCCQHALISVFLEGNVCERPQPVGQSSNRFQTASQPEESSHPEIID